MRVMEFRRHLSESLRETHIKEALRRLADKGLIEVIGERHDSRGYAYRVKAKEAV
jgi:predicted transcriptional regulator